MMVRIISITLLWYFSFITTARAEMRLELLGQITLPTGLVYENTEVGGLSGISYAADEHVFYAISDDRSFRQPARFYRLAIDIPEGKDSGPVVNITGLISLQNSEGKTFTAGAVDPEGIAVTKNGNLFISTEGVTGKLIPPFVALYNSAGKQLKKLALPEGFSPLPDGSRGVRDNMGFEALTLSGDGRLLTAAVENALVQDGETATLVSGSPCRMIIFDTVSGDIADEFFYPADPVPEAPAVTGGLQINGLVELLALEEKGSYLALERGFSEGRGSNIRLYHTTLKRRGGTDAPQTLSKELILNFDSLGIPLDNLEGMSFGPLLSDGRRSLVIISDNNFSSLQFTQILLFAVQHSEE